MRATYANAVMEDAVVSGVTEHGDAFRLAVEQDTPAPGRGHPRAGGLLIRS